MRSSQLVPLLQDSQPSADTSPSAPKSQVASSTPNTEPGNRHASSQVSKSDEQTFSGVVESMRAASAPDSSSRHTRCNRPAAAIRMLRPASTAQTSNESGDEAN